MSIESIQFNLKERFAAPLPEFYQRRIIFWQDEDREFESTLDELDLPGVNIVKLTGTNNFAVKKLLLHDDLTGNYLIYNPFSYAAPQDDWLRDIELYSEEFRADYYSILMSELNINASPVYAPDGQAIRYLLRQQGASGKAAQDRTGISDPVAAPY